MAAGGSGATNGIFGCIRLHPAATQDVAAGGNTEKSSSGDGDRQGRGYAGSGSQVVE